MENRYVSDVADGVRRLMRTLPDTVRKTEPRRMALTPGPSGRPRWGFPAAWLMDLHAGYWGSISTPKMEEKIPKSSWESVSREPAKTLRGAGEGGDLPSNKLKYSDGGTRNASAYPAGIPLWPTESGLLETNARVRWGVLNSCVGIFHRSVDGETLRARRARGARWRRRLVRCRNDVHIL